MAFEVFKFLTNTNNGEMNNFECTSFCSCVRATEEYILWSRFAGIKIMCIFSFDIWYDKSCLP